MISDITIGQYFPGNSPIHKMDARVKIVLTLTVIITIFLCGNFASLALVAFSIFGFVALSKIKIKTVLKGIKPLIFIIAITAFINLFYGTGEPVAEFWIFKITKNGIMNAVFLAVRIISLVVASSLLTYTTTPTALTDAIERLLKPLTYLKIDVHTFAMTMTIALRFIPTLVEEVEKITAAQKSRGADMESGNLLRRVKALIPVLIPLFVSSFRRANELAYAMECRCYRGGEGRTKMKQLKMNTGDYLSIFVVVLMIAGVILLNVFIGKI